MLYRAMNVVMTIAGILGLSGCFLIPSPVSVRSDGVMAFPNGVIYNPHTDKVMVLEGGEGSIGAVMWSPDGKTLLVAKSVKEKPKPDAGKPGEPKKWQLIHPTRTELWLCDEHGENWRRLTEVPGVLVVMGHWSPDGKMVSYTWTDEDQNHNLGAVNVETREIETLAEEVMPYHAWEPGGKRLAVFKCSREQEQQIGLAAMTLAILEPGVDTQQLAIAVTTGIPWVTWSQDGKRLLFCVSNSKVQMPVMARALTDKEKLRLSEPALFSMSVVTGQTKQLSKRKILYAVESPDGKHILFVELAGKGKTQVGVMNADGTGTKVLDEGMVIPQIDMTDAELDGMARGMVLIQPVWLSNTRVLYYRNYSDSMDVTDLQAIRAIDIDGKNKEELGLKIKKMVEALAEEK